MRDFFISVFRGLFKLALIAAVLYFALVFYYTQNKPQNIHEFQDLLYKSFSSNEKLKFLNSEMQNSLQKIESQDELAKGAIPAPGTSNSTEQMQSTLIRLQTEVDELKDRIEALEKHNRYLESQITQK